MIRVISGTTRVLYKRGIKPLLFCLPPDAVHQHMLHAASHFQRSRSLRRFLVRSLAFGDKSLHQEIHGVHFKNPVGLSAGFDKNIQLPPLMNALGFGFMEGGSITANPCDGNPRPWFYRLPKTYSIVVHVGLANRGVRAITQQLRSYPATTFKDFPLNVSIAKTNAPTTVTRRQAIDDYAESFRAMSKEETVRMITLNISCPNTYGGEPFTTPDDLEALLDELDTIPTNGKPVFVKMPSDLPWSSFRELLIVASRHNVQGVTIGNLTKDRKHIKDPLPAKVQGGLSGKPTWEKTNALIAKTYYEFGHRFTIIGVGGIACAEDAYTKITLGASLIELITGMIFEGPQLAGSINKGLMEFLKKDGYESIAQAIGSRNFKKDRKTP